MRTILTVIGVLTVAQWVFIGLLHMFLTVQDKRSPETLSKLHDVPVIGGYFPAVKLETEEDQEQKYADRMTLRLIESKKYYDLPRAFDEEEITTLVTDIKNRKEELARAKTRSEEREIQITALVEDLERREEKIIEDQAQLDELARKVELERDELELQLDGFRAQRDEIEAANLKKIAKWLNNVTPEKARGILLEGLDGATPAEREARYLDAAKVLNVMDEEAVAKIIETMDPVDWLPIAEKKKMLPVQKK